MKFVIQRVSEASVEVDGKVTGEIGKGFLVLIGVCNGDDRDIADRLVAKLLKLRIFQDENGKTNLDLASVGGGLLLVSQFTLYADCKHGNRPSFTNAGSAELAEELYEYIIAKCKESGLDTQTGVFGAAMKVSLVNDGPFTVILDSEEI